MLILKVYGHVHERTVTKKDGTDFKVRYQEAEITREDRRPRVVEIPIIGQRHYDDGLYTLSADSFRPDKYERLELVFPNLIPLQDALKVCKTQGLVAMG